MTRVYVSSVIPGAGRECLAARPGFQRPAGLDALCRREPDRTGPAVGQGGVHRNFTLTDGGKIREQLLALSDYDMSCTYTISKAPWVSKTISRNCR